MDSDAVLRWRRIESILDDALDLAPELRGEFLDRSCAGDIAMRNEVEGLLQAALPGSDFLEGAAVEFAAPLYAVELARVAEGTRIGPYRVMREVGRGGMGAVYLAERDDDQYRKRVALKLVHLGFGPRDHAVRRFLDERQILASLDHPNIARLLDGGVTHEGVPWFAMEYVEGTPIDRYCDAHGLTIDARLELFCRVAEAVKYAHANLVIHRDLKPSNIMVTEAGDVKLLDFGIAKLQSEGDEREALTGTGSQIMTPEYASPEQVSGGIVSTATDVYSLGVLLFELLTGERPHQVKGKQPHEVARAILEEQPPRPSTVANSEKHRRQLRGDLDTIVLMAMRREPERRYTSAERLEEDVRRHLGKLPVRARADSWRYRAGKFIHRHRLGVAISSAALLALLGFTVVLARQAARIRAQAEGLARQAEGLTLERDRARQTTFFLWGLMGHVTARDGRLVTVKEQVEHAPRFIEDLFAKSPEVQADLQASLAVIFVSAGWYPGAESLLIRAIAHQRQFAHDSLTLARYLDRLATVYQLRDNVAGADTVVREAITLWRHLPPPTDRQLSLALARSSWVLLAQAKLPEAIHAGREAESIERRLPSDERVTPSTVLQQLGETLLRADSFAAAETVLREAVQLYRVDDPVGRIPIVPVMMLGYAVGRGGRAAEGDSILREAIVEDSSFNLQSPDAWRRSHSMALMFRGDLLIRNDHPGSAEPLLREGLAIRRELYDPADWRVAIAERTLGWCLAAERRFQAAEPLLLHSLAVFESDSARHAKEIRETRLRLVELYDGWGKPAKAAEFRKAGAT